jgi:hypothetical protein
LIRQNYQNYKRKSVEQSGNGVIQKAGADLLLMMTGLG